MFLKLHTDEDSMEQDVEIKKFKSLDIEDMKMEEMQRVSSRPRGSTLLKQKVNAFMINCDGI